MRVIFVNRFFAPDESATSQLLTDLAVHLAQGGWSVHVIASRQLYEDPGARLPARERLDGVDVHRVWTSRFGRTGLLGRAADYLSFYLCAAFALLRLTRAGTVVVAKTDPPLISLVAAVLVPLRGGRLVNWLQDVFPEVATRLAPGTALGRLSALLRGPRNLSLRGAALNVVLGRRMAAHLSAEGLPPGRIAVIHNWADGDSLAPVPPADNPLRGEWGLTERFVVGYSGNMGRAHDFSTMLDAAEWLRHRADIVFVLIGGGHKKGWIAEQVRARGLPNVVIKPYQPRHALGLSLAVPDVHLVSLDPALEGLIVPSKLYGIAAVGRPVLFIGDPAGEVAGLLAEHECGASVPVGDGTGLAATILELSRSEALCAAWGRNARAALRGRYDRPIALAAWSRALAEVAGAPAHAPATPAAAPG